MPDCDVLIIGSGPAGVHAAWPLVMAGKNVTMIDGGRKPPETMKDAPEKNFEDIRRTDPEQWKWFLGEDLSGIPVSGLTGGLGGGQVSGNRGYVVEDAEKYQPMETSNALVIQSLAEGGLGAAWGAACAFPSRDELRAMGLPENMDRHFSSVINRIGVSGTDARFPLQSAIKIDHHATLMLGAYEKKRNAFSAKKLRAFVPPTAVLTEDKGDRKVTNYNDMDYWADPRKSVYRPQYTLAELKMKQNFTYVPESIVENISEKSGEVIVVSASMNDGRKESRTAKRVIVAAGAVNSARIMLLSLGLFGVATSFIGKPHAFTACLHPKTFGKKGVKERLSLCQLLLLDEEVRSGMSAGAAQLYSYRSLQLFRLLGSVPLPAPLAMQFLALLSPSLVIADIRFPAVRNAGNTLALKKTAKGTVTLISMSVSHEEKEQRQRSLSRLRQGLRMLGLLPVKTMMLPEASTSHYAGTIPYADRPEGILSSDTNGKIHGWNHVYAADASVFRALPPIPHTLTLMANANRIGEEVMKTL